MITKTVPIKTRMAISCAMKGGIQLGIWWKVNGNWDNNMIRTSKWREGHCRTNTSIRSKKYIQKSRTMRITAWYSSRKVNHLSKVTWERKIIIEFKRLVSFTRIGKSVLMTKSRLTKILGDGLIERTSSVRWNRIKNPTQRQRRWLIQEKEVRHWVK